MERLTTRRRRFAVDAAIAVVAALFAGLASAPAQGHPLAGGVRPGAMSGAHGSADGGPARFPVGSRALIDVSVATLWREPRIHRRIDRPSLRNPVALGRWNRNLRTAEQRRWLVGNVQTQALYAQEVLVRERRGRWVKVAVVDEPEPQDPAGYPGWLPARQLRPKGQYPSVIDSSDYVVVHRPRARVRMDGGFVRVGYGTRLARGAAVPGGATPDDDSPVGAEAPAGSEGPAGWVPVLTPGGPGRIRAAAVGPPKPLTVRSILADGRQFLRLRYLWGGLSAWGMDCSGIIWTLFRAHGTTIPRDADPQFRSGRQVRLKRLKRGDLIFWGTQDYVHHVAIYVGRGRMLEAPDSAGSVRVVPIRWTELVGARRYIPRG